MIIDFSAHHLSRAVTERIDGRFHKKGEPRKFSFPHENADAEYRLAHMEKYGIDMQALSYPSITQPVVIGMSNEEIAKLCSDSNDANFALCKKYPKKFVNICIISLLDVGLAMKEVSRAINELDCRAVIVSSNQKGKGLDSPEFFPFYEKIVEHDLPFFLHPTNWLSYPLVEMDKGWRMMHIFGWPFDTTQAVWRFIFGGVLDRFPSLKIVTHHLGAMLPYFSRRVEVNVNLFLNDKLPRPITEYWKQIYGDTAMDGTMAAFPCGYAFLGSDRMVYGTDYPMGPEDGEFFIRENLIGIRAMAIPEEEKAKILGGNAKKLLKIA
jgi:predicted TIM-barrel fold metal-dependent hydrolase